MITINTASTAFEMRLITEGFVGLVDGKRHLATMVFLYDRLILQIFQALV
jgi:hypothetical protein